MSLYKYNEIRETDSLVNKIVQQGQKLRNALVQSILNNDPFCVDVLTSQTNTERTVRSAAPDKASQEKLEEYLTGKSISREEEQQVLNTVQTMSAVDLCRITERSYEKFKPCDCQICTAYTREDLSCDLKRAKNSIKTTPRSDSSDITKVIQDTYRSQAESYLKHVDSLQIGVHNLTLNDMGARKVTASEIKLPPCINHTFFVEYHLPEVIANKVQTKNLPGFDGNFVRFCSKKLYHDAVYFKTLSVHDVANLDRINLRNVDVTFKISCRTLKQRETNVLGVARFNLGVVELSKYVSCSQRLPITLSESSPVVIGHLKVFVKLGCGRLYFGKEFVEAICSGKENFVAPIEHSVDSNSTVFGEYIESKKKKLPKAKPELEAKKDEKTKSTPRSDRSVQIKKPAVKNVALQPEITEMDKQILFGFLYVAEAQYLEKTIDSYFTCRPFCLNESVCSRLIFNADNPFFDFSQKVPLLYEDELLKRFHENCMVVEFWEKNVAEEFVFGLVKVSLNQLYVAYRNPVIVKYLLKNKFPVINTDWWEPIITPQENQTIGRVQLLLALGSEEQIKNLENERGFKQESVRARQKPTKLHKKPPKIDVAVQSDVEIDNKTIDTQQKMDQFLSQLLLQKQQTICVENATNTEAAVEDGGVSKNAVRKTADLLDSLEKALTVNESPAAPSGGEEGLFFKAHVIVDHALHLPVRKKCKSRKSKSKVLKKQEDCLPSSFVTFETMPGDGLKVTPVAHKTTNPKWDYRCDVKLPRELLTNSQKRLIFKVWRKANNNSAEPCLGTDVVLGFAALDLTVLSAGLPSVQGWFNIVDFSSKCNGQIKINITPLENITRSCNSKQTPPPPLNTPELQKLDESSELLSRTLKRKFIELDEITQRLRLRLSDVTKDESDTSNDELTEEFERDINTLCVEDDYDMINLQTETDDFNARPAIGVGLLQMQDETPVASTSCGGKAKLSEQLFVSTTSSLSAVDRQLIQGKQHIDSLLEKLTLMTAPETEAARYVSGCSVNQEAGDILKEFGIEARSNINAQSLFNADMFQQIYEGVEGQSTTEGTSSSTISFSECRRAPDGEGTSVEVKRKVVP